MPDDPSPATIDPGWTDAMFRLAIEASPSGQIVVNPDGAIILVNSQVERIFGYPRNELLGKAVECLVPERFRAAHPALREGYQQAPSVRAMGGGRDLFGVRRDGTEVPVEIGLNPFEVEDRQYVLVSIVDISERKSAENRLRVVLEASPNGLILVDAQGRIALVNSQVEHIFAYPRDELVGQAIELLVPQKHRPQHPQQVATFFEHPVARAMGAGRDLYGRRKDGSEVAVEIGLNPIDLDGATYVLASVVDISARKRADEENRRLQDQIQHAQRLESLGVLAGGIAHDFNNILVAVLGHADLAMLEMPSTSPLRHRIEQIQAASIRASELTTQMLAYAGKGKVETGPVDLNVLIKTMTTLLEVSIPKKILLRLDLSEPLPLIEGDAGQLQQVVMNLITNASEAIGERSGLISIHTGTVKADRAYLDDFETIDHLEEGYYAFVEVADTGCGMSPEVRDRLFDPFFTTKFTGRGLGMAAVLGIIRAHSGTIRVYTEENRGTKIKLLFPIQSLNGENEAVIGEVIHDLNRLQQQILIIDDEEHVRAVLSMMLGKCGFESLLASNGREGLLLFQANRANLAAVFVDMNMPLMNGAEVFRELKRIEPAVKVVLMSGYDQREATLPLAGKSLDGFIQKPFLFTRVVAVLEDLLAPG